MVNKNRLVIFGNGIDLALGLKTRYSDFILHYTIERMIEVVEDGEYQLDEEGKRESLKFKEFQFSASSLKFPEKNFLSTIQSFTADLSRFSDVDKLITELNALNIFFRGSKFFRRILKHALWCDMERTYYETLDKLFDDNKGVNGGSEYQYSAITSLNIEFDRIKSELEIYIRKEQDNIFKLLIQKEFFRSLVSSLCDDFDGREEDIICLNFNYTDTMRVALVNTNYEKIKTINIHGSVDTKDNPIVFGYGDDTDSSYSKLEDSNNSEYLRHFKSFRYSQNNNYEQLLEFINRRIPFDVCIVGHSCGLSDRTMLKAIFENECCEDIYIYHHKKGKEAKEAHFFKDINISRHFDDKLLKRARVRSFDPKLIIPSGE